METARAYDHLPAQSAMETWQRTSEVDRKFCQVRYNFRLFGWPGPRLGPIIPVYSLPGGVYLPRRNGDSCVMETVAKNTAGLDPSCPEAAPQAMQLLRSEAVVHDNADDSDLEAGGLASTMRALVPIFLDSCSTKPVQAQRMVFEAIVQVCSLLPDCVSLRIQSML